MKKFVSFLLILCLLSSLCIPSFAAKNKKEENLIINGGFEEESTQGTIKGWSTPQNVKLKSDMRYSGLNSLCIESKNNYISTSQTIRNIEATATYELKLMLLAPAYRSFSPMFTFFNEKNHKLSTFQPFRDPLKEVPENTWWEYECTFTAPAFADRLTVELRANLAELYIDDISLIKIDEPAFSEIIPNEFFYYTDWDGGNVTINTSKQALKLNFGKLVFNIKNSKNDILITKTFDKIEKSHIINFKTSELSPAYGERFILESIIYDGPKQKGRTEYEIVYYDRPTHLNSDGKWVEDNGNVLDAHILNAGGVTQNAIDLAKDIGVNVITMGHSMDVDTVKQQLDIAWREGLYCSISLYTNGRPCSFYPDLLKNCIEAVKDHPAVFSYAVQDEPTELVNPEEYLKLAYTIIRDIDKNHPVYVLESSTAFDYYEVDMKCVDIFGTDPYPADREPYSTYVAKCVKHAEKLSEEHKKPVYSIYQTFHWRDYFPTPEEARHMFYQSLMAGAEGVGYYQATDIWQSEELSRGLTDFSKSGEVDWAFNVYQNEKFDILSTERSDFENIWYTVYTDKKNVYADIINRNHKNSEKAEIPVDFASGMPTLLYGDGTECDGKIGENNAFYATLRAGACITYKFNYDKNAEALTIPLHNYTDLDTHLWAKSAINRLDAKGFVNAKTDETFEPASFISRGELALFLIRTLKLNAKTTENFADVSQYADYAKEVMTGKALGILNGVGDNLYAPEEPVTRQDLMTIISRALNLKADFDLSFFPDSDKIADYAKPHVAAMIAKGLIKGNADGTLNPLSNTTRAEAAVIMERIYMQFTRN